VGVLEQWQVTLEELDEIISDRPSLRGFLFGYLTEYKLRNLWFASKEFQDLVTPDNHDRQHKGDIYFTYKGVRIRVECKGLQTNSVKKTDEGYTGKFQCDASDKREITLPNGNKVETTCLMVGEFDLLAVGLFHFGNQWRYAFAKNQDLPRSRYSKYTPQQRQHLLAGTMDVTWPLRPPFQGTPNGLLDQIVLEKRSAESKG